MAEQVLDLIDQQRLETNIKVRETIISELMKDGQVPYGKSDRELLVSALDGMDKSILNKAKIKVANAAQQNDMQNSKLIAEMLLRMEKPTQPVRQTPVEIDRKIVVDNPVNGEMHVGVVTNDYETFMRNR